MKWWRERQIDGSRISCSMKYDYIDAQQEYDMWDMGFDIVLTNGAYIGFPYNLIWINPLFLKYGIYEVGEELYYKDVCATISHEFLHMLLKYTISNKCSHKLDNVCRNIEDSHTECGGL